MLTVLICSNTMLNSSMYALVRFALWSYVPDFATQSTLSAIHYLFPRVLHRQPPAPRTPEYARHYRISKQNSRFISFAICDSSTISAFAAVVLSFLLCNLVEASRAMPPNFYEILGVRPFATESQFKIAFRCSSILPILDISS